jgi:hypothetical protein
MKNEFKHAGCGTESILTYLYHQVPNPSFLSKHRTGVGDCLFRYLYLPNNRANHIYTDGFFIL